MDTGYSLIDLHLHGIGGLDTQTDSPEDILLVADMEGAEGVSAIVLSVYAAPLAEMRRHLSAIREAKERQRSAGDQPREDPSFAPERPIRSIRQPARIIGAHLEGPFLNPIRCGALNPGTFLPSSLYAYQALVEGFEDVVSSVTVAPELAGAPELIRQLTRSGVIVSMGHSDATFSEAEAGFLAGARGVTHIFNAMRPFGHREPGIAGFGLANPDVYVEVIADPYHLHLETIRVIFRTKPGDRILIVSDSVKGTTPGVPGQFRRKGQAGEAGPDSLDSPIRAETGQIQGGSMSIVGSSARLIGEGFDEAVVMRTVTENPVRFLYG